MKRNNFNMSKDVLTSFDMGELIPINTQLVVQGDVWRFSTDALIRFSPMLAPPFHPTHIEIRHFFVPLRIMQTNFEDFITGGPLGVSAPAHPYVTLPNSGAGGVTVGALSNYLGAPLGYNADNTGYNMNAFPFRAYSLIWNEYFRDPDLQTELVVSLGDGADATTNQTLQNCAWEKDRFTTSRPFAQKGAAVSLPLGTTAPVISDGTVPRLVEADGGGGQRDLRLSNIGGAPGVGYTGGVVADQDAEWGDNTGLEVDLTTATAADITDLRLAFKVQEFLEKGSRFGSRFFEWLSRFGIKYSDARLQRPEYLGGGRSTVQFSEVLQTAEGTDPVGTLRGHGIAGTSSNRFVRYFEEPGYIISLAYIRPKTIYTQGFERDLTFGPNTTKFDYWVPEIQFIGQEEVLNKEVYGPHTTPDGTFGWQDRYDWLRYSQSRVSGEFLTTLKYWHFGRSFASSPALNSSFVSCVPTEEPFAVPSEDTIYAMIHHNASAKRLVSLNGAPHI